MPPELDLKRPAVIQVNLVFPVLRAAEIRIVGFVIDALAAWELLRGGEKKKTP